MSKQGSQSLRATYQAIREQLIHLTIELEEKNNVASILTNKIEKERLALGKIELDVSNEYQHVVDEITRDNKVAIDSIMKKTSQLMLEKKELLQICQKNIDDINAAETENSMVTRDMHKQHEYELEQEKKLFRSGQEERLEKYLNLKLNEIKESTAKALQPEINRLQHLHEIELAQLTSRFYQEEKSIKEEFAAVLTERFEKERADMLGQQKQAMLDRQETINAELKASDKEHRILLATLQDDLDNELEKIKILLQEKTDKTRQDGIREVHMVQDAFKSRLKDLRQKHVDEIFALTAEHDHKIKNMREKSNNNKRSIEERVRSEQATGSGGALDADTTHITDEEAVRKEITQERDKRIQQEIRLLQAETFRLEREWRQRFEKEKSEIEDLRSREEKEYQRRLRQRTDEVGEDAVTREQLYHELKELQSKSVSVEEETRKVQHEIEVYENGINALKLRVKDIIGTAKIKEREETLNVESKITEIKRKCEKYSQLMKEKNDAAERELNEMDYSHQNELERLDTEVKSTLENKDEEIEYLRDSVHTEKVKAVRLEKLLKQYSSRH